jgi:hypothetical protein
MEQPVVYEGVAQKQAAFGAVFVCVGGFVAASRASHYGFLLASWRGFLWLLAD